VVDVLADLVNRGYFDVDLALVVGRRILYENGVEFWRLAGADGALHADTAVSTAGGQA
jgi:hypothetical protein